MQLLPLTQDTEKAEEVASRYVRAIFVCKLLLSAIIIPIALVALIESPYIFAAFKTEFRIAPILRSVLIASFYLAVGLFCLKAFAVYFPIFGPLCGAPIHSKLWHLTMFSVGLLFDAMVVTPRMFLGSAIDSLFPSNPTSNGDHLFSRQTHALLILFIASFAAAFYLGWHPGYSDFVAQAREHRRAELAQLEQWLATLDERLNPLPRTEPPIDPTAFESLLPPQRVAQNHVDKSKSDSPSDETASLLSTEPSVSDTQPPAPPQRTTTIVPPLAPTKEPPEAITRVHAPSTAESKPEQTTPPATPDLPTLDEPPNPFQKGTTWEGMSVQISDGGINSRNDGIQIRTELTVKRQDADQFEALVRCPWVIDAQGKRVRWGATASARGTFRDGKITIRSTPLHIPPGTILLPGTWTGTVSDDVFSGEIRGNNNSRSEITLQMRTATRRRSASK